MTAKNRGNAESVESDWYRTPAETTRSIFAELRDVLLAGARANPTILEPTAGKGAIVAVAREFFPMARITAIELDRTRFEALRGLNTCNEAHHGDFAEWSDAQLTSPNSRKPFDVAAINPPFTIAKAILERAIPLATHTLALLRLGFLASADRKWFWNHNRADIYPLAYRPSFAASLKCAGVKRTRMSAGIDACDWAVIQDLDDPRAEICPQCGVGRVDVNTSDSADYMWAHFHPDAKGVRVL